MKHYRLNQIAMAVLGALLLFFGTRTLINILFEEHKPEKPGLEVTGTEEKPKAEEKSAAAQPEVIALLATADAAQGEADAALCKVCHTFDKGGAALIGPNLHDVVGRKIASVEGFNYSPALKAKQSEGVWDYAHIDAFITNPQAYAPGTMMAFPGVPDVKKRANIIAFLRTQTDNPPPLPEAAPAAAPAEEKAPDTPEPKAAEPEPAAPAEEAPAAEPEAPAAEPEAPAAEPEPPAAEPEPPAAEEPAATEEPETEEPAPAEEAEPSAGEEPNPAWPQPVYPDEPTEPVEGAAPLASEAPSPSSEESNPAWPQPVYPDETTGPAEGAPQAMEASSPSSEEANPAWPQPVYPDGSPN